MGVDGTISAYPAAPAFSGSATDASSDANAKFRTIFEQGSYFAGVMNVDGTVVEANQICLDSCGFVRDEVIGRKFWQCGWWNRSPALMKTVQEATRGAAEGVVFQRELEYFIADGSRRYLELTIAPAKDAAGRVVFLIPTGTDITERKRAQDALTEAAKLAAVRAEISSALVGGETIQGVLQKCAEALVTRLEVAFARIWTLDETDAVLVLQASAGIYTHLDGPHGRINVGEFKIGRIAQSGRALLTNDVAHDPNISSPEWARREGMVGFAGYPMTLEGRVIGVMGMFSRQPFSETAFSELEPIGSSIAQWMKRKQTEEALRETRSRIDATLVATEVATWTWDIFNDRVFADHNLARMFALTDADAAGGPIQKYFDAIHPDDRARVRAIVLEALQSENGQYEIDYRLGPSEEAPRWVVARGKVERNTAGQAIRFPGVVIDITARKQTEEALRASEERLKEAQRALAEQNRILDRLVQERTARLQETVLELEAFSFSISHDLRSPLRAMQGYADALLHDYQGKLDPQGEHYLQRIVRGATRLDLLVRDVLAYSKVAKGAVQMQPVDLGALIQDIIQNYPNLSPARIAVSLSPLPHVLAHEGLLTQVVSNLLENAVKFASPGTFPLMRISAQILGEEARICFDDNGMGIAPEHHRQIFEIFGRVHPEKSYEGTGIGLAIVKKAIERMGGSMGLVSELGKGSRFGITLRTA